MAKTHFLWSNRPEIKSWMFIYVYSFIKWEKSLKLKTLGNLLNSSEETIMFYFRTFPPVQQKNNPSLIQPPLSSSNLHLNLILPHLTLIQPHLNLIQALYPSSKPSTFIQPPVPLSNPPLTLIQPPLTLIQSLYLHSTPCTFIKPPSNRHQPPPSNIHLTPPPFLIQSLSKPHPTPSFKLHPIPSELYPVPSNQH